MKPKDGHNDTTYRPPEHGRDAFGAQRLIGLSEQSKDGVAKFAQSTGPSAACMLIRCPRGRHDRGLMFQ
jgi:hypothetical protein